MYTKEPFYGYDKKERDSVIKAGYKQTELGVIPEDWDIKAIGQICRLINGRGFKPFEWKNDGLPIIRIQNLNGSDEFNYYDGIYDKKIEVENGQLLFAWSGSRGTSFGPHVWRGSLGLLNYHTWKMVVKENEVDAEFFLHALKQQTKFIEDNAHGASALVHTQKWEMEGFEVALPSTKPEQTAIAKALSDTDALIQSLSQLIAKKRQIKQGAMQSLLNPYDAMGALKAGWEVKKLGDVLKIGHGRSQYQVISLNGQYPILASGGEIGRATSFLYDKPSVLIGRKGTIDVPQYMDKPFWTIDTLFYSEILKPNNAKYIFYQFCLIDWYSYNEASGVPSLSAKTIENIDIVMSPSNEQTQIAKILTDMDTEITALETKLSKYQKIKQGMMQNLLTGRIRLITPSLQAGNKTS